MFDIILYITMSKLNDPEMYLSAIASVSSQSGLESLMVQYDERQAVCLGPIIAESLQFVHASDCKAHCDKIAGCVNTLALDNYCHFFGQCKSIQEFGATLYQNIFASKYVQISDFSWQLSLFL